MEGCAAGLRSSKTLHNRFVRWGRLGVFDWISAALVAEEGVPGQRLMIDSTYPEAHRTAASLLKEGMLHSASNEPRVA